MRSNVAYDNAYRPIAAFAPYLTYWSLPATYSDRALFGNLTWRVTSRLDLTGGLRYDRDSQAYTNATGGILKSRRFAIVWPRRALRRLVRQAHHKCQGDI